jgi:hypothetical protein
MTSAAPSRPRSPIASTNISAARCDFHNLDILFRDDDGGAFSRFKTFTQEFRLQGTTMSDRLDWLVGGYYANEKLRVRDNLAYGTDYLKFAMPAGGQPGDRIDVCNRSDELDLLPRTARRRPGAIGCWDCGGPGGIAAVQAAIANPATPPAAIPGCRRNLRADRSAMTLSTQAGFIGAVNANPANPALAPWPMRSDCLATTRSPVSGSTTHSTSRQEFCDFTHTSFDHRPDRSDRRCAIHA